MAELQETVQEVIGSKMNRQSVVRRGKMARDGKGRIVRHEPTVENIRQVQQAGAMGIPRRHIAALIGIDEDTLRKHYDEHLTLAEAKANLNVATTLYKAAVSGADTTAAIFWAKARLGWRDRDEPVTNVVGDLTVNVVRLSEGSK